jgi:chromosomal replication initiator protein
LSDQWGQDSAIQVFGGADVDKAAERVLEAVASHFKIEGYRLIGGRKTKKFLVPRWIVMCFLKEKLEWSYPEIGKFLKRDHTSVMHGVKRALALKREDPKIAEAFTAIEDALGRPGEPNTPPPESFRAKVDTITQLVARILESYPDDPLAQELWKVVHG